MDIGSYRRDGLSGYTLKDELLVSELLLYLKEFKFSKQKFRIDKLLFIIKYHYLGFQNNNIFHVFNYQLDYGLSTYIAKFETRKSNIDRFLSNLLMALLMKKLFY